MPKAVKMLTRKDNAIYENWKVFSCHDKLMFRCNAKKAQWYLQRNLATLIPHESCTIKLNFEAKGSGHPVDDYMNEERSNTCVACGFTKDLTLHHVVPDLYRRWMPLSIKSKSSRDILPLCKQCHNNYEVYATALKKEYSQRYGVPLEGRGWIKMPENTRARKAASALLRCADKIPAKRHEELRSQVTHYWGQQKEWNDLAWEEVLQRCVELKDMLAGPEFAEHGQHVVSEMMAEGSTKEGTRMRWPALEAFIRQWRQHFLDHLQPKHLSKRWTVDSDIYTD